MKSSDEAQLFHVNWDDPVTSNIFYQRSRMSELNFGNNSEAKAMDKNVENHQNRRIQGPIQDPKISSTSNGSVSHMG